MGSFDYDSRNRLIQSGKAGSLTSYAYDAEDVLVGVTEPGGVSRYTIDRNHGLSKMLQRFKNGDRTRYVHGVGLIYETDGDDFRVYHYDYRGSTVALTDEAGAVIDRFTYTPYGVEARLLGSTDTPFRYNGQYGVISFDDGLVHMRARFYHPELRRFLNADPLQFGGGNNWFAFANGNPVSYVDPFGLFGWKDLLGFVPVSGSVLDAVDSFKEGNILMGVAHLGLAALDATGGGLLAATVIKSAGKYVAKKALKKASKNAVAAGRQLGLDVTDVPIKNGVAHMRVGWASGLKKADIDSVKAFTKLKGAKRAEVDSGFIINPKLRQFLNRRVKDGNPVHGGKVRRSKDPFDSDFTIDFDLK